MTDFVTDIKNAAARLAEATTNEMAIEDVRINTKLAAIARIMSVDNALTGKPHSFSSAEAIVNTDDEYQQYLERLRTAAHARIVARGDYDAAVAAARLQAAAGANV